MLRLPSTGIEIILKTPVFFSLSHKLWRQCRIHYATACEYRTNLRRRTSSEKIYL